MVDVIVIGAGMAGLTAARELVDAGKQVVLLEARERIGGRVYTRHNLADVPIELGGELISGRNAATWELIRAHHITTVELGALEPNSSLPSLWDIDLSTLPEPGQDESMVDYAARTGLGNHNMPSELRYIDTDDEPLRRVSAGYLLRTYRHALAQGELYGEHDFRIPGGYDQLLEIQAKDLVIELGARVEEITWEGQEVTATFWQNHAVHTLAAKQIVISLPIGVLKHDDVQFIPALPKEKQQAIDACSTVDIAKLVYVFGHKVLPAGMTQLADPKHNPYLWWNATLGSQTQQDAVVGWSAGDNARKLLAMDYEATLEHGLKALRQLINQPNIQPIEAIMHDWAGDPFTRGAYSFVPAGAPIDVHDTLAKPIDNKLFWAGEATNSNNASTVHGAYESGLRAAAEILGRS